MVEPLRVIMIAEYPFSDAEQGRGGVMQSNFHLVEGFELLADPGLDLHVLSQTFGCDRYETRRLRDGITLHFVPKRTSETDKFFHNPLRLLRAFWKLRRAAPADIVHGQGSVIAIVLSLLSGRKSVQTIHGIYRNEESKTEGARQSLGRRVRIRINEIVEGAYLRRISNLIAITGEIAALVREMTGGLARIFPTYIAIDTAFFGERVPAAGGRFTILFVAAITPRKGVHVLLEAFETLAAAHTQADLRIVGIWDWAPDYVAALREKHAAMETAGRLIFTGGVSRERLAAEFAGADLLVLSSLAESAPAVVSQAMCMSIPVVATGVGGVPQMVEDGVTGLLVPPGEAAPLAQAMARVIIEPGLCDNLGRAARKVAVARYHPRSVAQVTAEVYRTVAAGQL